jgi:hypothetical protein
MTYGTLDFGKILAAAGGENLVSWHFSQSHKLPRADLLTWGFDFRVAFWRS